MGFLSSAMAKPNLYRRLISFRGPWIGWAFGLVYGMTSVLRWLLLYRLESMKTLILGFSGFLYWNNVFIFARRKSNARIIVLGSIWAVLDYSSPSLTEAILRRIVLLFLNIHQMVQHKYFVVTPDSVLQPHVKRNTIVVQGEIRERW